MDSTSNFWCQLFLQDKGLYDFVYSSYLPIYKRSNATLFFITELYG